MRGLVDAPNPQTYNAPPILGPIVGLKGAGWSSLVARRAHNPKVVGSNPAPATNFKTVVFSEVTFRGRFLKDRRTMTLAFRLEAHFISSIVKRWQLGEAYANCVRTKAEVIHPTMAPF